MRMKNPLAALLLGMVASMCVPVIAAPAAAPSPLLTAAATTVDPVKLVADTSEQVRAILLRENGKNTEAIRKEVDDVAASHFDYPRMTALAVGKYWKQASATQKVQLTTEFKTLLMRTYFSTMLRYRDVKINVKPDALLENDGKQATVKSEVKLAEGKVVAIDYSLYSAAPSWKVFNVVVEGASLVTVYRNQFGEEISKSGIDGLIQSLQAKNKQPAKVDAGK